MNIFKAAAQKFYEQARKDKRFIEGRSLEEIKQIRSSAEWGHFRSQTDPLSSDRNL